MSFPCVLGSFVSKGRERNHCTSRTDPSLARLGPYMSTGRDETTVPRERNPESLGKQSVGMPDLQPEAKKDLDMKLKVSPLPAPPGGPSEMPKRFSGPQMLYRAVSGEQKVIVSKPCRCPPATAIRSLPAHVHLERASALRQAA